MQSFAAFVTAHWARFYRLAYLLTGSVSDAEGALPAVLVRTWNKWEVRVPSPPDLILEGAPRHRRLPSSLIAILSSAAVLAVLAGAGLVVDLQRERSAPPVSNPTSSSSPAETPLDRGKSPGIAIVDGNTIKFGGSANPTGLEAPLSGSSSALAATVRDRTGDVWYVPLKPGAEPEQLGDRAVSAPVMGADGRSSLWLADGSSGLTLMAAIDGPDLQVISAPLPQPLSGEDPANLVVGMDQLRRAFVGSSRETWRIDWYEDLSTSGLHRVSGITGGIEGIFANEIVTREGDRLSWGYVSGGDSPRFHRVGSAHDATSVVITLTTVFSLNADGQMTQLETTPSTVSNRGESWPVLTPTGQETGFDLPTGTRVTSAVAEGVDSILATTVGPEGRTDVVRCSARTDRCELTHSLAPTEYLLVPGSEAATDR